MDLLIAMAFGFGLVFGMAFAMIGILVLGYGCGEAKDAGPG